MNLKIKHKLIIIVALVLFGFLALFAKNTSNQNTLTKLVTIQSDLKSIQVLMLQLRRAEKDFLLRKDIKYLASFDTTVNKIKPLVTELEHELIDMDIPKGKTTAIGLNIEKYRTKFKELVDESVIKGLDKESGNYGKLRKATHELEEVLSSGNNLQAQVYLLTLRRHEKDFMLRNDEKYLGRLIDDAQQLGGLLTGTQSKQLLATYLSEFQSLVTISKKIGLNSKSGIQGDMRKIIHIVEDDLNAEIPRIHEEVKSSRSSNQFIDILVTIVLSIIVFITVMVVAKQIITQLQNFSSRITEIRIGNDLSQRTEVTEDEIGDISKEFNSFMAHFQSLIKSINKTVQSLEESTSIVSNSVVKTSEGLQNQSIESEMVVTAVTEMGMAASEIARNAHNTKDKTDKASIKADEGKQKLTNTVAQINGLSTELIEAGEEIIKLQEKSDGINSVLDVIKGIAEQTNLLALNAAIEAARAGEQGRGFAVVADEVRTLAVRTQDSTAEITTIINELQSTTSSIVITVNHCKDQSITSVSQAKETEEVLNEIMADVDSIAEMTMQVATAVEEQSAVVAEVDKNLVRMRDIGEQVAIDSQDNAKASQQVASLAQELHKEANVFKI
jgi:methyl-accepting chemotaxis protein